MVEKIQKFLDENKNMIPALLKNKMFETCRMYLAVVIDAQQMRSKRSKKHINLITIIKR